MVRCAHVLLNDLFNSAHWAHLGWSSERPLPYRADSASAAMNGIIMVLPIKSKPDIVESTYGPTTSGGYRPVWRVKTRTGRSSQKRPYNLTLGFSTSDVRILSWDASSSSEYISTTSTACSSYTLSNSSVDVPDAYNKAWDAFKGALQNGIPFVQSAQNAGLGETFAEGHQAMSMIAKRASQLRLFSRHLRRFEFGRALDDLKEATGRRDLKMPSRLRRNAKSFGNNFLEFHFGWAPLLSDIHGACEVINNGVPPVHVSGRGKVDRGLVLASDPGGWPSYWKKNHILNMKTTCKIGARVAVTNPNVWLLNQLGLLNPVTIAWDLVPFSFIGDWLVNISSVLDGYTDLYGLTLEGGYTTYARHCSETNSERYQAAPLVGYGRDWAASGFSVSRSVGIGNGPSLRFTSVFNKGLSVTRGVTAISLLLQALR